MPVLPGSLALTVIPDGSPIVASNLRTNYTSIQGAVNSLIGILDDGNSIDGDALVWDATLNKWSAASRLAAGRPRPPRITTSTIAGGPPASPLDGDIWIATAIDALGARWQFQYNAGSGSAYKWEFIGGTPARTSGCSVNTTATQVLIMSNPLTMARGGEYLIRYGAIVQNSGGYSAVYTGAVLIYVNGASTGIHVDCDIGGNFTGSGIAASAPGVGCGGGQQIALAGTSNAGGGTTTSFAGGFIEAQPTRIQ
jgi:hypothetical protein